jgi:hypothetical protein
MNPNSENSKLKNQLPIFLFETNEVAKRFE